MHKHLVKWLSEFIKRKEKGVLHMLARRRCCLDYSKVYSDVTEIWLLAWNKNKQVTYYVFYILIPNSVLILVTIVQICYQQISVIRWY